MFRAPPPLLALALAAGSSLLACGSGAAPTNDQDPDVVVAFASNFMGYKTWPTKVAATAPANAPSGVHTLGPMTAYLNKKPPSGSKEFPVGTIIVKETDDPDPVTHEPKIFAMVKRGGGFNLAGATNWEWFELKNLPDGSVLLIWRGVGPPAGELYGGDPATCNGCHVVQKNADFVWTTALQLSTF